LAALPKRCHLVALCERGAEHTSRELAARLEHWMGLGSDIALVIGGPDGIADEVMGRAAEQWSLSRLTLPHALARVMAAEALYRALTIHEGLPYHRD
nr:23S rRNA (pseudouridine(1915)-N(3))-methyltransferase RlmH [Succinivibrionaceae bacterium]